ncbi:hypothetical protein [Streptomyces cavernae]|uniref:hypothetical protein n=1 Tax=Streptomyces cavernae TaxID=2259034 RepID=UPI000FEB9391|nr:hypothetical protein [Streptomyces cavernae]
MNRRRDTLPIADYDHLPVESLEHRIRSLGPEELSTLDAYERDHGNRTAVRLILQARLDQLRSGSPPSAGASDERAARPKPPRGGSKVTPETAAEPIHPPPHGTPDQRGKPKANRA